MVTPHEKLHLTRHIFEIRYNIRYIIGKWQSNIQLFYRCEKYALSAVESRSWKIFHSCLHLSLTYWWNRRGINRGILWCKDYNDNRIKLYILHTPCHGAFPLSVSPCRFVISFALVRLSTKTQPHIWENDRINMCSRKRKRGKIEQHLKPDLLSIFN